MVEVELRFAVVQAFARGGIRFPTPEPPLQAGDPNLSGAPTRV